MRKILLPLCLALPQTCLRADVRLPAIFSDHMVLQKAESVPVWGKADPGEEVAVTFDGKTATVQAGADGQWMARLDLSRTASGPFEMRVEGRNCLTVSDVLVGEVWLASGQSNMEWKLKDTTGANEEIAQSGNPFVRQFLVKKTGAREPKDDCEGRWVEAGPADAPNFSAVGYYFAKTLQRALNTPVGILNASCASTPCEAWMSQAAIDSVPDLKAARLRALEELDGYLPARKRWVEDFEAWLKKNNREDRPFDAAVFAGPDVTTQDWTQVRLPGPVSGKALPPEGVVWLRKTVMVEKTDAPLDLNLGPLEGFESIYWNGVLIKSLSPREFPGVGYVHAGADYRVPAEKLKAGENVLAIRLYAPAATARFPRPPKMGARELSGEWLAKAEFALPELTPGQLAEAPSPPAAPFGSQRVGGTLFNAMIHPVAPYALRGILWYQGEENVSRAFQYRTVLPLLIKDWRRAWKQEDLPFYFCQLPNHLSKKDAPGESKWAELREAQSLVLKLPATAQAVLIDLGEANDIHPRNKKDVGARLAAIALARNYGRKTPSSGPVYESMVIEGPKIRLAFSGAEGGLVARPLPATCDLETKSGRTAPLVRHAPGGDLEGFAVCGPDRKWEWAEARIDGDSIVVWSDKVPVPVAARYAWADNPTCNLFSAAGFPASPFRTDDFPAVTRDAK